MDYDTKKYIEKLIKTAVVFGVITLLIILAFIAWLSFEVASVRDQTNKELRSLQTYIADSSKPVDVDKIAEKVASIIEVSDGKDGRNGKDGQNGKNGEDSVSTHTVIEKKTIVHENKPGQNGSNGKTPVLGKTASGNMVWKYDGDREWQDVPVVDVLSEQIPPTVMLSGDRDG